MNIGYIRISSKDQNPQRQIEPIQNLTERVYIDKVTGRNANRPQLKEMLLFARMYLSSEKCTNFQLKSIPLF